MAKYLFNLFSIINPIPTRQGLVISQPVTPVVKNQQKTP
jgi:hypothetical protein